MAANVGLTLAQVLAEIYNASSTCLAVGEKRRLAARALAMAMRAETASTTDDMLEHFEGVLSTIQTAMGLDQLPSVTKGKDLLRKAGATQLASRVGRLSRRRNGHAHPDVSLDGDILRHFQTAAVASKTEGSSQQHEPEAEASASPEELEPYGHKDEQKDKALRIELDATTARLAQATKQLQEQAVQHTKEVSAFKDTLATNQDEYASLVGERDCLRTKLEAAIALNDSKDQNRDENTVTCEDLWRKLACTRMLVWEDLPDHTPGKDSIIQMFDLPVKSQMVVAKWTSTSSESPGPPFVKLPSETASPQLKKKGGKRQE